MFPNDFPEATIDHGTKEEVELPHDDSERMDHPPQHSMELFTGAAPEFEERRDFEGGHGDEELLIEVKRGTIPRTHRTRVH